MLIDRVVNQRGNKQALSFGYVKKENLVLWYAFNRTLHQILPPFFP